jgi:two-component system, OmpR family, KDP operon response regulator KdpE
MPRVAPLRVADLEIDALTPLVRQGTREIRLTPGEHILLYTVAAKAGAVVNYRDLADALGRIKSDVRNNTLARHLSSLRRKLGDDAHQPRYIETVIGVGYRLVSARKP